jgi:hypothetical protein
MGRPGLLGTMARTAVVAGTATAVAGRTSRWTDRRAAEQNQPVEQAPAPPSEDDRMARIRELGEMRSNGLLTDDEFSAEKARILAS